MASSASAGAPGSAVRGVDVDRWLCSWNWVEPAFSRYLYADLIRPGLRAIAPTYGVDFIALARHAVAARRRRAVVTLLAVTDLTVLVFVVPIVFLTSVHATWVGQVAVGGPILGVLGLFILVGWHLYVSRGRASETLLARTGPRDQVPALDAATEARLGEHAQANVVVFGGGIPFVGAGVRLDRWKVRVDTTRAATDHGGGHRKIIPLTAEQLQKELTTTVRGAGIPRLEVHNRLFVAGDFAGTVPGLLPDPYEGPRSVITPGEVRRRIEGATDSSRTYLCMELRSGSGELVVTVYVRVDRLISDLFVEFHAYVLLPLAPAVRIAGNFPVTGLSRLTSAVRDVVPTTVKLVRNAPRVTVELARWRFRLARRVAVQRRLVRKMAHFNYGAVRGVQSILAAKQREDLFTYEDEDTYLQALRTRILATIVKTVGDHGIDTSELERQQKTIINKIYRIGQVKGRNVVIGDNATFNAGLPDLADDDHDDEPDDPDDSE